jgi:hypothetical protein
MIQPTPSERLLRTIINTRDGTKDKDGAVLTKPNKGAYDNFLGMLKKLHPDLVTLPIFIRHSDWEINGQLVVPLPDGYESVKDLPTDFTENAKLLQQQKDKLYEKWIRELENGEYGDTPKEESTSSNSEELSMAELARRKKEQEQSVSEIIEEKEEEPVKMTPQEQDDAEASDEASSLESPIPTPSDGFVHPAVKLTEAIKEIVRDVAPASEASDHRIPDIIKRIEAIEAKLPFIEKLEGMFK